MLTSGILRTLEVMEKTRVRFFGMCSILTLPMALNLFGRKEPTLKPTANYFERK